MEVSFENHKQILSRTNTRNAERKFQVAKSPGSESSRERKFQGAKVPGSEWSWERKVQLPGNSMSNEPLNEHLYTTPSQNSTGNFFTASTCRVMISQFFFKFYLINSRRYEFLKICVITTTSRHLADRRYLSCNYLITKRHRRLQFFCI